MPVRYIGKGDGDMEKLIEEKVITEWQCPRCDYSVLVPITELSTIGNPICTDCVDVLDTHMELVTVWNDS